MYTHILFRCRMERRSERNKVTYMYIRIIYVLWSLQPWWLL